MSGLRWAHHFHKAFTMAPAQYRIESRNTLRGSLLPPNALRQLYTDRSLAVAVAVKSLADPTCQDIRVVHVASGEIVFQTAPTH
ncbi:hypothetical protein [Polaromonas sp.]|uniref:hypothetical protein n=1 Tax=Polaromonas sp. TaxID=1869339 RepID=UPI002487EE64|nr:hypothetical protein [Polaromonas sp.]MDI1273294.1 hypothetical protein [Polaromonas sp.]MDI1341498.1 hypothetical protein [Polaromonas sp.]